MTRHRWALPLLVVLLVCLPIAEVWLLIAVGQTIGVLPTLGVLVVEAVLGGWLLRREGGRAWRALNGALGSGRMPAGELADAALVLVGGVLLMLPGFVTDLFGLLFLLPVTRPFARRLLMAFAVRQVTRSLSEPRWAVRSHGGDDGLIEGEVVEDPDTRPPQGELR